MPPRAVQEGLEGPWPPHPSAPLSFPYTVLAPDHFSLYNLYSPHLTPFHNQSLPQIAMSKHLT